VEITWTVPVELPTISRTANTAYLSNGKIIVNPTILEQNGKTSAAYEALLNNAFMQQADEFIYTGLTEECEEYLTPYFVFASDPEGYVRSDDLTKLYLSGHKGEDNYLAAIIEPIDEKEFYIRLNHDTDEANPEGSVGNYPPLSDAAKGLVGKTVSVQPRGYINGATVNWIDLYNPFNVEFIYPLEFALPTAASVYDEANNGNHVYTLNLYDPSVLIDWNNKLLNVTTQAGRDLIDHYEVEYVWDEGTIVTGYQRVSINPLSQPSQYPQSQWWWSGPQGPGWYIEVTAPTLDFTSPFNFALTNWTSSIRPDGTIDPVNVTYPVPAGTREKMSLSYAAPDDGLVPTDLVFTWTNGATGAIQDAFKIAIPVSVTHKWGVLSGKLIITVNPGSGPAPEVE
jgi:hypothetical protein